MQRQFKAAWNRWDVKISRKVKLWKFQEWCQTIKQGAEEGPRLQHRAIFHSPPPDRIRLGMPTQSLKYSWDDRMHHYNKHLSPKMSHLEFDYFVSIFFGSDQVNFTVCFSWLNCWLFLQAAPKPLLQCCAARSAVGGKSLQSFTGESPFRTESTLAPVARISPQVQRGSASVYSYRQQLGISTEHKSDFFSKTATFILTYPSITWISLTSVKCGLEKCFFFLDS